MASNGDPQLLTDLRLELSHHELRPVYAVAEASQRVLGPQGPLQARDVGIVEGRDNLGQAIVLRLLTPIGELADLAHPDYGSRLSELIGRTNTETTRHLVKLFVLASLQREPRIAQVAAVDVQPSPGTRDRVDVTISVVPVASTATLTVGPISLGLSP